MFSSGGLIASYFQLTTLSASGVLFGALSYKNAITRLENALYVDFAEHWQL